VDEAEVKVVDEEGTEVDVDVVETLKEELRDQTVLVLQQHQQSMMLQLSLLFRRTGYYATTKKNDLLIWEKSSVSLALVNWSSNLHG